MKKLYAIRMLGLAMFFASGSLLGSHFSYDQRLSVLEEKYQAALNGIQSKDLKEKIDHSKNSQFFYARKIDESYLSEFEKFISNVERHTPYWYQIRLRVSRSPLYKIGFFGLSVAHFGPRIAKWTQKQVAKYPATFAYFNKRNLAVIATVLGAGGAYKYAKRKPDEN